MILNTIPAFAALKIRGAVPPMTDRIKIHVPAPLDAAILKTADVPLTNGVIINNQSVAPDAWNYYSITVPAGMRNLTFTTTNSTGDIDIYGDYGPFSSTPGDYCASETESGNETCVIGDPKPGIWWLGVYGYDSVTVNYSVKATFSTVPVTRRVTPSATSGGTISPTTVQTVVHGANKTFTVTPNTGYIASVGGTCGGNLVGNLYTTVPIIEDCTVVAGFFQPIQLTNGVTLNNQSVGLDAWKYYKITVAAGIKTLTLKSLSATGDVDIYVHLGTPPNEYSYDCAPYTDSGNESCIISNPTPGTWWLGVYGYEAGTFSVLGTVSTVATVYKVTPSAGSGGTINPNTVQMVQGGTKATFTVTPNAGFFAEVGGNCYGTLTGNTYTTEPIIADCTVVASFSTAIPLTSGVILNNQSVVTEGWKYYKITAPAGTKSLVVLTSNATGDVDLYVRRHSVPTEEDFDCAPYTDSGNETCVIPDPATGTWWIGVYGYEAGNFSVKATVSTTAVTYTITPSATSGGTISPATVQTVAYGATKSFTVTPNAGYIAGMGGTCGGTLVGNVYTTDEIIGNCTVIASFTTAVALTSGVALNNQGVAIGVWKYYKITVPAGTRVLTVATTNATGDVDLYVHRSSVPTEEDYDCAPETDSGNENCVFTDPIAGIWWIGVYGYAAGNFSIKATISAVPISYSVTPSAIGGGTISPATVQTVVSGTKKTFTLTPNAGLVAGAGGTCGGTLVGNVYTTNNITANCTVVARFSAPVQLTSGVALNNQSVVLGAWKYYKFTVPANAQSVTFATTNATADVDILVRLGNKPDFYNYNCAPFSDGGNESCVIPTPTAGIWWIGVYGYKAGNFSIKATAVTPAIDFVINTIILTPAAPAKNTVFKAAITVKNIGTAAGDGKFLDVWIHQPAAQTCGAVGNKRVAVGTLAAGATKVLTVTGLPAGTAGAKTLRTFVDSGCGTAETNEGNNQFTKAYTVQ